jgi:hypothetical protein
MPPKVRRVGYSPDEYIAGVGGVLNVAEQGMYWMICSLIMSEGGPVLQNDRRLSGLCLCRPAEARRLVESLVAKGKIRRSDDGQLSQKRALSEVELSMNRIQNAVENGPKGGRPKGKTQQKQQPEKAEGFSEQKLSLTINHQPLTEKETPNGVSKRGAYRLEEGWVCPSDWIDEAVAEGMPKASALAEAERMKNWSMAGGKNTAKLNWRSAWRNWYRDKLDGAKPRVNGKPLRDENGNLTNSFLFARG